ncbi:aromatic ring-opening dioxygenase LigA [Nocardioides soli]|uniref:Putative phage tail protein n=1 Tax=Nocardioides soli TaxID=1036020 RepID=A0A7W4Z1M8_9ACTN|nr:aromatic ring-opening dioxygenase LigA [Nocardioides soli]MBB3043037.1 putative phage tail protein [Nocardioides soli]
MTEPEESPAAPVHPGQQRTKSARTIGIIIAVLGAIFLVAGVATYAIVSNTLAQEHITVSDDARWFAGKDVKGPFTAYSQADIIATHAEEIAGGKTYSELAQDDPNRATVMNASFLRASLFTSVVAFGVAAFVAVMGVVLMLLGWGLVRLSGPRSA